MRSVGGVGCGAQDHGKSDARMTDWDRDDEYDDEPFDSDDEDDATDVIDCPACGAEIYAEAEQCPVCGEYVTATSSVWDGKPTWWVVLAMAGILATVVGLMSLAV